jgi:hypothetical protein
MRPGSTSQYLDTSWPTHLVHARAAAQQVVHTTYEASSLTFEEYARLVVDFAKSTSERNRRMATHRRLDILRDAWAPLLVAAMQNWVTPEVRALVLGEADDHIDISRNPAKHIWKELAVLTKLPPLRSTSKQENIEKYNKLLEDTGFDTWWQLVELLLNACNEVVIWPDIIERNGKKIIKHRYAVGDTLCAIPLESDSSEIECWCVIDRYLTLKGNTETRYKIWTDDWHGVFKEDDRGDLQRVDFIDEALLSDAVDGPETDYTVINPYGAMPMIRIRLVPWGDIVWDITSGEDLCDLTIHGGVDRQFMRYLQKVCGFKQGVATGNVDNMPKMVLDPGFMIKISGDDTKFNVVDWQVNLQQRLDVAMADELAAASSRGINPELYKRSTNYQTGVGAQHAERGLAEYRLKNSPVLEAAERAYYKMVCIVAEAHGLSDIPDPEDRLEVEYSEMAYPQDPKAQLEVEKGELSLSIISHIDLIRRRHPNWNEEQIREHLDKRLEDIAKVNEMKVKYNVPNNPTNESASAEENGKLGPEIRDNRNPLPGSRPGNQRRDSEED